MSAPGGYKGLKRNSKTKKNLMEEDELKSSEEKEDGREKEGSNQVLTSIHRKTYLLKASGVGGGVWNLHDDVPAGRTE